MTLKQLNRFLTKIVAEGQTAELIFARHNYTRIKGEIERQLVVYFEDELVDIFKMKSETVYNFLQNEVKLDSDTLQTINIMSHRIMI